MTDYDFDWLTAYNECFVPGKPRGHRRAKAIFRRYLYEKKGGKCDACGDDTTLSGPSISLKTATLHHVKRLEKTDPYYWDFVDETDFELLCFSCHRSLHAKDRGFDDFNSNPDHPGHEKQKKTARSNFLKKRQENFYAWCREEAARALRKLYPPKRKPHGKTNKSNEERGVFTWRNVVTNVKYRTRDEAVASTGFSKPTAIKKGLVAPIETCEIVETGERFVYYKEAAAKLGLSTYEAKRSGRVRLLR